MTEITRVKLDEMLAGLEGVTPGPWELSVHGDHSQYFGNIIGNYGPNELGVKSIRTITVQLRYGTPEEQRANGDHMARCDPDTMRALIALASQALRSQGEAVAITPHMLNAGTQQINRPTMDADDKKDLAVKVFRAMDAARRSAPTHPAPQEAGEVAKVFVKQSTLDMLAAMHSGSCSAEMANIAFGACTVPLYAHPPAEGVRVDPDSIRILQQFATMYRSGAQGCEMDFEAAQALALSIDDALSATEVQS